MKNFIPYIYILFFWWINPEVYSQEKKTLVIEGTNSNSDLIIQKIGYKKEMVNDSMYEKEIQLLRNKLDRSGFIQHEIVSYYKNDSIYYANFKLNNSVKNIRFRHVDMKTIAKNLGLSLQDSTSIEIPFNETTVFFHRLVKYYQNNAYPFVEVNILKVVKESGYLMVDLFILPNDKKRIDKIVLKGYTNFPRSFISQSYNINIGDPFSKNKISELSELIQTTKFVSEIKKPEVLFTTDSTALYLYLKREKSNFFDGLIGFSTSPETQKIQLYGNVDLRIQNSLNHGETLQLNWLSTQNQSQTLKLYLETPFLFNTPFTASYNFDIFKQDTTFVTTTHLLKSDYQITNNNNVGFLLEVKSSNTTTTQNIEDNSNFSSFFYGVSYRYNKPNNHPIFNNKIHLYSHVTQGERDNMKQLKIANFFQYLFRISNKQNILIKNSTELLISDNYLENELYRIGGSKSIRGFDENNFIADSFSYLNSEYNYLLSNSSYLSTLVDIGLLRNKLHDSLLTTYSFGIGFTQQTKIGQLGIQYFIGNTDKNSFSFNNSKLHLNISQTF